MGDPDGATFRPTAPATTSATCPTASARCASLTTTALAWAPPSSLPSVWPTTRTACASLTLTPISPTPLPVLLAPRVCNQTAQCNYVFLSPEQSKKEDSTTIIAVASVVGLLALILVVVGVLFFVKRYRDSEAAFQTKLDETENA